MGNEKTVEEKIILATEKGLLRIVTVIWFCLLLFLGDETIPVLTTVRTAFENHFAWGMIFWSLSFLLFWTLVIYPLLSIRTQTEESRKETK